MEPDSKPRDRVEDPVGPGIDDGADLATGPAIAGGAIVREAQDDGEPRGILQPTFGLFRRLQFPEGRAGSRLDAVHPPDGFCQRSGFRFRLPPMELALLNMLRQAKAHHLAWTRKPSGQSNRWRRDAVLASMARHFCDAARPAGGRTERVTVVWYLYLQSYATGAEMRGAFLSFGWDCEQARIDHEIWLPDDATVVLHWGEEPWE